MITEKSCGAVVFTKQNGYIQYVIIRSRKGIYGFPKGHVEGLETERETALREVAEETGLKVALLDGFRAEDSYTIDCAGALRMKQIVYFLAEYSHQHPIVQETELSSIHSMRFEEALTVFQFSSSKRILTEAHTFLLQQ